MANIRTSAINDYNTAVVMQSGRVGTVRYYTKNGLTYVRAASNSQVTNNRTNAQMTQRLAFASLCALYSTLKKHLYGAFTNKAQNQSDHNAFMKANQGEGVYLNKQSRELGYSVAMPVVVAIGKEAPVGASISGGNAVTNLQIGSLNIAGAKISELSAAIVAGNNGWDYGDQLTIVVLRQSGNYCRPQYIRIVLEREDETLVSAFGSFSAVEGCLAMAISGDACVGFIHSTPEGGMSYCKLVATESMLAVINGYLTDEAFAAASASYGKSTERFLVPAKNGISSASNVIPDTPSPSATKYQLTVKMSPAGSGSVTFSPTSADGKYAAGTVVTMTAVPASGKSFDSWSDDSTGVMPATRTITMDSDKTVTAYFG